MSPELINDLIKEFKEITELSLDTVTDLTDAIHGHCNLMQTMKAFAKKLKDAGITSYMEIPEMKEFNDSFSGRSEKAQAAMFAALGRFQMIMTTGIDPFPPKE